jgi:hypothetical protein
MIRPLMYLLFFIASFFIHLTAFSATVDRTKPTTPTSLAATPVSTTEINLSWVKSTDTGTGVKGYRIYKNGRYSSSTTSTTFKSTGLNDKTSYSFAVSAYDGAGTLSSLSKTIQATTLTTGAGGGIDGVADLGYIGCSMTMGAVDGAVNLGSSVFWNTKPDFGGGGVWQWAQSFNNKFWTAFQNAYNAQPVSIIWWQLCSLDSYKNNETYDNALLIIDELKRRIPGVTIYVSAQPAYDPVNHVCTLAGASGPTRMATLAAQLTTNGEALAGPVTGPLKYPDQTKNNDSCHPNTSGEQLMGQQIINFFE